MDDPMRTWCRDVAKHIRFRYDRAAVEEELYLHLEESRDDRMEAEGLSREAAEAEAIAAMGDPVALGKELDQVHGPLLGWTWRLSRVLVRVLFVSLVSLMAVGAWSPWGQGFDLFEWVAVQFDPLWTAPDDALFSEQGDRGYQDWLAEVEPAEVTAGPYTISVLEGELMRTNGWDSSEGRQRWYRLLCYLRVEAPFWHKFPDGLSEAYLVFDDGTELVMPEGEEPNELGHMYVSCLTTEVPSTTAEVVMEIHAGEWHPQWVELRLPEEIGDFALRLNLNYQEVTP